MEQNPLRRARIASGEKLTKSSAFEPVFTEVRNLRPIVAFIPDTISPEDEGYQARFREFPLNIVCAQERYDRGTIALVSATYWFEGDSFVEDTQIKEMKYRPLQKSPFFVAVQLNKKTGTWTVTKPRGKRIVSVSTAPQLDQALLQLSALGLQPDEPLDADGYTDQR